MNYISLSKKDEEDGLNIVVSNCHIQIPDFENIYLDFEDYKFSGHFQYGLKSFKNYINDIIKDDEISSENNFKYFKNVKNADQFIKLIKKLKLHIIGQTPETVIKRTIFHETAFFNSSTRLAVDENDKKHNEIVVFTKIIDDFLKKSKNKLEDIIKPIYIYSIFTFFIKYLHLHLGCEGFRRDYKSVLVNESLSLYLAKEYCVLNKLNHKFLLEKAKKHSPAVYPFSGSLYIKSKEHFNDILELSIKDFDNAFKRIFDGNMVEFDYFDSDGMYQPFEMPLYIYIINFRNGYNYTSKLLDESSCF